MFLVVFWESETTPYNFFLWSPQYSHTFYSYWIRQDSRYHFLFFFFFAGKLKDLHSLLTLPGSYGAVGTGAAHQYAKPWHQNKRCLPEH